MAGQKNQREPVHNGNSHDAETAFKQLAPRWDIAYCRGDPDEKRCNRHQTERIGPEPNLPVGKELRCRRAEELHRSRSAEAAIAVAIVAAAKKPTTRGSVSRLKAGPNQRSINHIASSASPALHRPKAKAPQTLLSPMRLAARVAAITPAATGKRAPGPSAISIPTARPEAGQNTATRSAVVRSASPNCAVRK